MNKKKQTVKCDVCKIEVEPHKVNEVLYVCEKGHRLVLPPDYKEEFNIGNLLDRFSVR